MKNKIIKTGKGEFLVIEFPQGVVPRRGDVIERTWVLPRLPEGKWLLICRADEIDEEQAKDVVDYHKCFITEDVGYQDYKSETDLYRSATMSLYSLLEANEVVFDYDRDNCPNYFCDNGKIDVGYGEYMSCSLCEESQSKVCNKENTYLFKKI